MVLVAGALVVSGGLSLGLFMSRALPSGNVSAAPAESSPIPSVTTSVSTRTWTAANRAIWAGRGRRNTAFELQADNNVSVWMRTVRPMLVVRCMAGRVDAFVYTASAAKIEAHTEDHTVRFSFDDGSEVSERWPDSEEHDALFAPDGAAFARRIAGSTVMRFGFTPHNAAPVSAQFHVAGLSQIMEPAARECGLKR